MPSIGYFMEIASILVACIMPYAYDPRFLDVAARSRNANACLDVQLRSCHCAPF